MQGGWNYFFLHGYESVKKKFNFLVLHILFAFGRVSLAERYYMFDEWLCEIF